MATNLLEKKELSLQAFMVYKYGTPSTHVHAATPNEQDPKFGQIIVEDVPLMKDAAPFGRSLGWVRGLDVQVNQNAFSWQIYHNIIFNDGDFNGSSLLMVGQLPYTTSWSQVAIVGGTGKFTMAQGVVYGKTLPNDGQNFEIVELHIRVFYSPLEKPALLL